MNQLRRNVILSIDEIINVILRDFFWPTMLWNERLHPWHFISHGRNIWLAHAYLHLQLFGLIFDLWFILVELSFAFDEFVDSLSCLIEVLSSMGVYFGFELVFLIWSLRWWLCRGCFLIRIWWSVGILLLLIRIRHNLLLRKVTAILHSLHHLVLFDWWITLNCSWEKSPKVYQIASTLTSFEVCPAL